MQRSYSFIIPVYNRPDEIAELLASFALQEGVIPFEIVIIEDGSTVPCLSEVEKFPDLDISYFSKGNSGPGSSRNYGMRKAKGTYFIILDSDCILPSTYVANMHSELEGNYVDFFGGPDAAHPDFSHLQKAISYSMTSFLTTGGIRGGSEDAGKFQPRSFNMGLSKQAFEISGGFGDIHPGEDPDLVLRLWKQGFESRLIKKAYVYHKRRISWKKFYTQVHKFGLVRPILNSWHPMSKKTTYWFPSLFIIGLAAALIILPFTISLLCLYVVYFIILGLHSTLLNKNLTIGVMSVFATLIQFYGYGTGFLSSSVEINWRGKLPKKRYPHLFFK
ncbi:glycosyltransferase [Dokdonia sp. Hel_I_53]|uniref:glycosyltransferase n=1 Tax=Dokdonia sp. Hel_I_53 TaxID=1566287 RepID=UPI00119C3D3A|nr:glycosyltransferase [Dokdonia sp. Hel_I_53]TVZ53272.1 GT2 family glycosyltransferase [Dokdonia sp. Hel_I_53]